jgi:ferredoxin
MTTAESGRVRVEPAGVDFVVFEQESMMHAAERQGLHWPTACHGHAECAACSVEVVEGGENLTPVEAAEQRALEVMPSRALGAKGQLRLACQARVRGPVVVIKRGVRPL